MTRFTHCFFCRGRGGRGAGSNGSNVWGGAVDQERAYYGIGRGGFDTVSSGASAGNVRLALGLE
jgi:hypothetical protein